MRPSHDIESLQASLQRERAPLKSLSLTAYPTRRALELAYCAVDRTLRSYLDRHPQIFRSLTSFHTLTLAEGMEDVRRAMMEIRHTLVHFGCDVFWRRMNHNRDFRCRNPPSPWELEREVQLDFSIMTRLRSVDLSYDSPRRIGFRPTFPAIISTLRTIPWKQLEKFRLILWASCPICEDHRVWRYEKYTNQLDDLISPHVFARGKQNLLHEVKFRIIKSCLYGCNEKGLARYSVPTDDVLFPKLEAHSRSCDYVRFKCHVEHNSRVPESQVRLLGSWDDEDEED
jgi:hypothetical protein